MASSGKQSPLGVNVLGALLTSTGLTINPIAAAHLGSSKTNAQYTFGSLINDTCLRLLTWAINDGWYRGPGGGNATLTNATYNNLISISSTILPALGNAKPATYLATDPAGVWSGAGYPATTGYDVAGDSDQEQSASWLPYDTTNTNNASITQWGYLRLHALQAWNEFNWNGTTVTQADIDYKEFCSSFMTASGWLDYNNQAIIAANESDEFLEGTYSNMNDLISADIAGVSLSAKDFGDDLINLGKVINLNKIDSFGLPSVLLATLGANNAVTTDLTLALLSAGLESTEISQLITNSAPFVTIDQEQKIFGAFLVIIGDNLTNILAPLQCRTLGLNTLADLLNVKKMFPISFGTLTVPRYNSELGLPTNSKTYYLIYEGGAINGALTTPAMNAYVGIQTPKGNPPVYDQTRDPNNYRVLQSGFGSYLRNIIPADQAIAAGAFSFTMRQIRNIEQVDFVRFAKAVKGMENMQGLDLVNGTSKPTNQTLLDSANTKMALGSGPKGTYTFSDMFGSVSGLPYPWKLIKQRINELQTVKLTNIYQQLFLAVTWEAATVTLSYTSYMVGPDTFYQVTGVNVTNPGGGYGRGSAVNPVITISDGTTAVGIVDRNDLNAGSNNGGTYGRVLYAQILSAGTDGMSIPTVTIQTPPIDTLPVSNTGIATTGTNQAAGTSGWASPMNGVVQAYIDQAAKEISFINFENGSAASHLRVYWNGLGSQLMIEQRTRTMGISPVLIPKDEFQNPYPMMIQTFVDSIPSFAMNTLPHMSVQTLETIVNLDTVGGQSVVALMRQERNQARLMDIGIDLDNNITDQFSPCITRKWTTNGTVSGAKTGVGIASPNGEEYTLPSWPANMRNGIEISPEPAGTYECNERDLTGEFTGVNQTTPGDITPILDGQVNPQVGSYVCAGPSNWVPSAIDDIVIVKPASELDPSNLIPNLDPNYISSTMLPFTSTIRAAIDQVIECNCDCWIV